MRAKKLRTFLGVAGVLLTSVGPLLGDIRASAGLSSGTAGY